MHTTHTCAAAAIAAALLSASVMTTTAQTAPPAFELPTPTGPDPIGTTSWRLSDRSRPETFGAPGEFRQVEVIAWYPATRRGGAYYRLDVRDTGHLEFTDMVF